MKSSKFRNKKRGHYRKTAKTYRKKSLKKRTRKMRGGRSDELFYAIDKNDVNLVKRVLDGETILYKNKAKDMITGKKETDINARNKDGYTPLTYAINKKCNNNTTPQSSSEIKSKCNNDVIKLLIERGADVNFPSIGYHIGENIIIPGMNPDTYRGSTPLIDAINNNLDREIIELLIKKGANVNQENSYRYTPLGEAFERGAKFEIFELLINRGARISESLLYSSLRDKFDEKIIKLLIENGADVDYSVPLPPANQPLFTPLLWAIKNNYSFDIIKLLIDKGATILVKNKDGYNGNEKDGEKKYRRVFEEDKDGVTRLKMLEEFNRKNDGNVSPFSLIFPLRQQNKKEYDKRISLFIDALNLDVDKYNVSIIEYDEDNNIYNLIQLHNSLESNEYYYKVDDKVINFVKGVKKEKKKTRKDDGELKPKNKTRKIKPIAELVLEDEEIIEEKENLESKYGEEPNKTPLFDESGNVSWNNEKYDKLWRVIPHKLKQLLLQDHDWLEDYMNSCVKLRKEGKECKLFLPKQAHFPPDKLIDGKYDFGSDIVNKLFNGLSPSHQDTLLTVYSVKDGVKNYDSLKYTLASILAQQIGVQRGYFYTLEDLKWHS